MLHVVVECCANWWGWLVGIAAIRVLLSRHPTQVTAQLIAFQPVLHLLLVPSLLLLVQFAVKAGSVRAIVEVLGTKLLHDSCLS